MSDHLSHTQRALGATDTPREQRRSAPACSPAVRVVTATLVALVSLFGQARAQPFSPPLPGQKDSAPRSGARLVPFGQAPAPKPTQQTATMQEVALPQSDTLDLEQAVVEAVRAMMGEENVPGVIVENIMTAEDWAFGTAAVPARGEDGAPEGFLFLGRYEEARWQIALSGQPEFEAWRNLAPDSFPLMRRSDLTAQGILGDGSAQLGLPWRVGEVWTLTGGPHTNQGYNNDGQPDEGHPRSALDFAGGSGVVYPARDGMAYRLCPNFVLIDHGDGWYTGYYHLDNIRVGNGVRVSRWTTELGNISSLSGCGGSASGAHVHFTVRRNSRSGFVELSGMDIGGWTVEGGSAPYQGCLVRGSDRRCVGASVVNDGRVGSSDPPPPNCPAGDGVILYQHANYDCGGAGEGVGYVRRGSAGFQNVPDTFHDRASSIRIPNNWSVRLFEHSERGGASVCVNAPGDADFSNDRYPDGRSLNDTVSSFEVFTMPNCGDSGSGGPNYPPNTPTLRSPHDWYVARDGRAPVLCWNNNGDPNGDAVEFFAEVFESARNAQSGWTRETCWRPAELDGGYFGYQWRVKARDARGAQSGWSAVWHFTIEQPPQPPQTSWQAEYWDNRELRGGPRIRTSEGGVYFFRKWGWEGGPHGLPGDNWSARLVKRTYFPGGRYRFHCHHDDGCRVFVDGRNLIDAWWDSSFEGHDQTTNLSAGEHEVKVEYYEKTGFAALEVWWQGPGYLPEPESCDQDAMWCGEYWGNRDLMGTPAIQRREGSALRLHWGNGGPHPTFPADQFSARYRRRPHFACGRYRFHVFADDGVKMWVDDALRLNEWRDQVAGFSFDLDLSEGRHPLQVEYYENGGGAAIEVSWEKLSDCAPGVTIQHASEHHVRPGVSVDPLVRVQVQRGSLDPQRADALVWVGGHRLGAPSTAQVVRYPVHAGQQVLFNTADYPGFRMTAPAQDGVYESVWRVRAAGAEVGAPAIIRVTVDGTPPILSNLNVSRIHTHVLRIAASGYDNMGIERMRFSVGHYMLGEAWQWRPLGWDTNATDGWTWDWNVMDVPDQRGVALYVEAWDRAGNQTHYLATDQILDRQPPRTQLYSLPFELESTAILLRWAAEDLVSGIARFDFKVQEDNADWQDYSLSFGEARAALFLGQLGRRYRFRMRGVDEAGNAEPFPHIVQAEVWVRPCVGDAFEPDNDFASARRLELNVPQRRTFCGLNDEDWVTFWAERGKRYVLRTYDLARADDNSFATDTVLSLYSPDGVLIAENDDWNDTLASYIAWTPTVSGWHVAKVRQWNGNSIAGNAVAYTLVLLNAHELFLPLVSSR